MNISTFSPALVVVFVCALLWILMDVHFRSLTPTQKWLVPLLFVALAIFNHILRQQMGAASFGKVIVLTLHLPYFLIFLRITKCGTVKMIFMILSAVLFTAPTILVGNLVKHFTDSLPALLLANLLTYAAVLLLAQYVFRGSFNYMIRYGDNRFFLRFSLIPLLYYLYLFAAMNLDFSFLSTPGGYVVRLLPTVYVFVFYFLLTRIYKELDEKRELEAAQAALRQQMTSAEEQISMLSKAQSQTAIYQHNMRHHLNAIAGYLSAGNPAQAEEYIRHVQADVEAITPRRFCEHELVNLLCSSFLSKADALGIRFAADVKLSKTALSVSDTELCSLLSNALENAFHAVQTLEAPLRWVEFSCQIRVNKLLVEVKNPYEGEILMRDGLPASARKGHGYGCRSIRSIAQRSRGIAAFEAKDGLFTLQAVLPLEDRAAPHPSAN